LLIFFALLVIGVADEITQPLVNLQASYADLAADVIGIVMVQFFSMLGKRRFSKTNTEELNKKNKAEIFTHWDYLLLPKIISAVE